jgi:hypothetical protein
VRRLFVFKVERAPLRNSKGALSIHLRKVFMVLNIEWNSRDVAEVRHKHGLLLLTPFATVP